MYTVSASNIISSHFRQEFSYSSIKLLNKSNVAKKIKLF